ncbi:ankyrin repeat domain-containing protein 2-like [Haliotis rufescens]|uniref:ankyrin repeat domain-containing protein 2-like n=1 Tax=Haliotis rufescens TaxID=6454 RepID=UPI00201F0060|nr:ankyrin repeat domain-containing protein 2-like [Haliotis rufescens]
MAKNSPRKNQTTCAICAKHVSSSDGCKRWCDQVLTKPSASKVCNRASQSLESGSGKAVGVQASGDLSQDRRQSKSVLVLPVTTQKPASRVTPSPANCHDLYVASRDGKMMDVKRILSSGNVNINCRAGRYCKTPVMWAAYGGHREVLELLINFGADLSVFDSGHSNLLFWACLGGHVKTVEFILSLGAVDINALNINGWTAVDWAKRLGHQRVVDLMLSWGAY